jgi:hypothetical protein
MWLEYHLLQETGVWKKNGLVLPISNNFNSCFTLFPNSMALRLNGILNIGMRRCILKMAGSLLNLSET